MNATRRNQLRPLASIVCDLRNRLAEIAEEERTALDSTPETLVTTERYERDDEHCYQLEESVSVLEELESLLDEICDTAN